MTSDALTRLTEAERKALADEVLGGADPSPLMVCAVERILTTRIAALAPERWPAEDDDSLRAVIGRWSSLYRDAVGVPPSEHQRRRLDAMAEHIETLTTQLCAAQSALAACREVAAKRAGR